MTSKLCALTTLIKKARSSLVSPNSTCAQLPHNFRVYLRLVCEKNREEAFITYIKPLHCLKELREPIIFNSAVKVFILWRNARTSFNAYRRSVHVSLRSSEMCPQPAEALVVVGARRAKTTTTALSQDSVAKGLACLLLLVVKNRT